MERSRSRSSRSGRAGVLAALSLLLGGLARSPAVALAQRSAPAPKGGGTAGAVVTAPLAFQGVAVVDVQGGRLLLDQTVVVTGNRIQTLGSTRDVRLPRAARVVDGRGKYLIPGLWDMHAHVWATPQISYPLFVATGVTGVREMSQSFPIDSMLQWRREIVAGKRVGPRVIGTGGFLYGRARPGAPLSILVTTPDEARRAVDSLKAAGADFIKFRDYLPRDAYFAMAAEARRLGLAFAGHTQGPRITVIEASDSGQRSIEHINDFPPCHDDGEVKLDECAAVAAAFARNGTWFTPTLTIFDARMRAAAKPVMELMHRAGVAFLAGSDVLPPKARAGFSLHDELVCFVEAGLTPAEALRTATLNPAKYFSATDSLGTVAPGRLGDLVLLDADPLADIRNTLKIRAVLVNGRYFDRAALDTLITRGNAAPPAESSCGG
jgi:imidazolonepropionase-like amidohydrolase